MKTRRIPMVSMAAMLIGIIAAGCAEMSTVSRQRDRVASVVANPDKFLHVGMTTDQLKEALGSPDEVRPLSNTNGRGETWVYRARVTMGNNLIAGRTETQPYFDPFTNETREVEVPVYTNEAVTEIQLLNLLIYDGKVAKWVKTKDVRKQLQ